MIPCGPVEIDLKGLSMFQLRFLLLALAVLTLFSGCVLEEAVKAIPLLGEIYRLPDIDQRWSDQPAWNWLIKHRSILTHNALIPLAVAWFCRPLKQWGVLIALVIGSLFSLHFCLDLFPKKWYGYAFIHIPVLGWLDWIPFDNNWIPTVFSVVWLGLNLLLSQFAFVWVLRQEK